MPKIFISYRRDDTAAEAGRIYEKLIPVFGEANVIKDIDTFPVGSDFRTAITEGVIASDVMLVLIGKDWLKVKNSSGQRRLDDPDDFVRYEVDLGLRRAKMQVIPVILGSAHPPNESELPNRLRELAYKNAAFVRDDPDFSQDMERLTKFVQLHFPAVPAPGPKQAAMSSLNLPLLAGFVVLLALIVAGFMFLPSLLNNKGQGTQVTDNPTEDMNPTEASSPTNTPTDEPSVYQFTVSTTECNLGCNVRAEPNLGADIVAAVAENDNVMVTGYLEINLNDDIGWFQVTVYLFDGALIDGYIWAGFFPLERRIEILEVVRRLDP